MRHRILPLLLILALVSAGCVAKPEAIETATTDIAAAPTPEDAPDDTQEEPSEPAELTHSEEVPEVPTPRRDGPVIAVLDTGIRADHKAFLPGQVVAWYDFTDKTERDLARWDPLVVDPFDDDGHGTAVASLAAGVAGTQLTPSHAPGASLAIARVLSPTGAKWMDMARAVRWAVDVAEADVISISIYSYIPYPTQYPTPMRERGTQAFYEALAYARTEGVLVVALAGNGMANAGAPTVSWLHVTAASPDVLVVGGARDDGTPVAPFGSLEPEVTAHYTAMAACPQERDCKRSSSGTSFSTPLVAGMAATLYQESRRLGEAPRPDLIEDILKRAARDSEAPPSLEGYGFLDAAGLERALAHLRGDAELPARDMESLWVDTVQAGVRDAWRG